jgi:predicted N-acyltransferase
VTAAARPAPRWITGPLDGGAAGLGEAEWNRLARRGFHLHQWFRAAEQVGWRARHVAVREGSAMRSVVPAYLTGAESQHDLHERWLGPLRHLERIGLGLRPVLTVQAPFALTSDSLGDVNGLPRPVLEEVFDVLEDTAMRERAKAVVWPFVDPSNGAVIALARDRGYAIVPAGCTARLRVWWTSFDEYLASRSKSVRRTIRGDLTALGAAGLEAIATTEFRPYAAAMDSLYREAYRRRNGRPPKVGPGFFELLAAPPSAGITALITRIEGRVVGTSLNLAAGEVVDGTFAAFAAAEQGGAAYVNDLVYEPVRLACRRTIPAIDLGMSALYPKVLRGARLRRRVALVRGTGPAIHHVLMALGAAVARRQETKERQMLGPLWGPKCYEDGEE